MPETLTARCATAATEMIIMIGDTEIEQLPIRPRDRWRDTLRRHGYRWAGGAQWREGDYDIIKIKKVEPQGKS